jgi:hypothetical protein
MQVPLIIRAPWITSSVGFRTGAMAELVDLYPTAVALSGLPAVPASEGLEGTSLLPVMEQPTDELAHNKSCASTPHTPFLRACVRACVLTPLLSSQMPSHNTRGAQSTLCTPTQNGTSAWRSRSRTFPTWASLSALPTRAIQSGESGNQAARAIGVLGGWWRSSSTIIQVTLGSGRPLSTSTNMRTWAIFPRSRVW